MERVVEARARFELFCDSTGGREFGYLFPDDFAEVRLGDLHISSHPWRLAHLGEQFQQP